MSDEQAVTPAQLLEQAEQRLRELRVIVDQAPSKRVREAISRGVAGVIATLENFRVQLR